MEQRIGIERMEEAVNLFGSFDENIRLLEAEFQVQAVNRGGEIVVSGEPENVMLAVKAVQALLTLSNKGETITDQTPAGGAIIPGKSSVILYVGEEKSTDKCVVPHLIGKTPSEANTTATAAGLLIRFSGTTGSESSSVRVLSQSIDEGTEVEAGTVITVQLGDTSVTD